MEIKGKSVIVTGGAGFIGSNLVERLAKENQVTVVDNMHTGTTKNLSGIKQGKNLKILKIDVKNIANLKIKPDIIFHLGMYSASPMYKEDNHRVNEVIEGAVSLFKYAVAKNAKVVFASSSSVYNGNAPPYKEDMTVHVTDFYTEARYCVERLAELYNKLYGIDVTGLRLFSVYGKHEENKKQYANLVTQFIWAVRKRKQPIIYGNGEQTRDFIYVDDIVDAFIKGADQKGFNIYNAGTGRSYSLNQLIEKLSEHMGTKIKPKYVKHNIKNYVEHTLADTTKARTKLNFKAKCSLDEGIERILNYY